MFASNADLPWPGLALPERVHAVFFVQGAVRCDTVPAFPSGSVRVNVLLPFVMVFFFLSWPCSLSYSCLPALLFSYFSLPLFLPAGACGLRQVRAADGGRVSGSLAALLLLRLLHLYRAQHPKRPARAAPRVVDGVPPHSERPCNSSGIALRGLALFGLGQVRLG